MNDNLIFDTRNRKGKKYYNCAKGKKGKSMKAYIKYKIISEKYILEEMKKGTTYSEALQNLPLEITRFDPRQEPWYRIRHHRHCHLCNPKYEKTNNVKRNKNRNSIGYYRKKHFTERDFDYIVN